MKNTIYFIFNLLFIHFSFGNVYDFRPGSIEDIRFGQNYERNLNQSQTQVSSLCSIVLYSGKDYLGESFFIEGSSIISNVNSFIKSVGSVLAHNIHSITFYDGLSLSGNFIKLSSEAIKIKDLSSIDLLNVKSIKVTC